MSFIKQVIEENKLLVTKLPGEINVADIGTRALTETVFKGLRNNIYYPQQYLRRCVKYCKSTDVSHDVNSVEMDKTFSLHDAYDNVYYNMKEEASI